jgi:hypothetical protein
MKPSCASRRREGFLFVVLPAVDREIRAKRGVRWPRAVRESLGWEGQAMRGSATFGAVVILLSAMALGALLGSAPSGAQGSIILETATLAASPVPDRGIGGLQWLGARFSVAQPVQVDHIGTNLAGASTIFGAIVPLSGLGGLPPQPPDQIASYALASATFTAPASVADASVPLSVTLAPGNYGLVFGVGAFGASGAANLSDNNIPTSQSSLFSANLFLGPAVWLDQPTAFSGLRLFVTGTVAVPEPSAWILSTTGLAGVAAVAWRRHRRRVVSIVRPG